MPIKTYVLLDHLRPTAPISVQVSKDQRVRLDVLPLWEPFLQVTFYDNKTLENRTIRLKLNSNTPYQDGKDGQIEKEKIPANVAFTKAERDARKFINGVNVTTNTQVQAYLEAYPAYDKFDGYCSDISGPAYKLFDQDIIVKSANENFKKRLKAANKIASLDLKGAQDLLIRIYGVAYKPADDLDLAQNVLVDFMDATPEVGIDEILRGDTTLDDETQIMIGRLVHAGVLSFEAVQDQVVKKGKDGRWVNLKAISDEYTLAERQRYFSDFITGVDGRLLMQDLKVELAAVLNPGVSIRTVPPENFNAPRPQKPTTPIDQEDEPLTDDEKAIIKSHRKKMLEAGFEQRQSNAEELQPPGFFTRDETIPETQQHDGIIATPTETLSEFINDPEGNSQMPENISGLDVGITAAKPSKANTKKATAK